MSLLFCSENVILIYFALEKKWKICIFYVVFRLDLWYFASYEILKDLIYLKERIFTFPTMYNSWILPSPLRSNGTFKMSSHSSLYIHTRDVYAYAYDKLALHRLHFWSGTLHIALKLLGDIRCGACTQVPVPLSVHESWAERENVNKHRLCSAHSSHILASILRMALFNIRSNYKNQRLKKIEFVLKHWFRFSLFL